MLDKTYTGVGSRKTPEDVLKFMYKLGKQLASLGFTLRSGGASGADTAFELGHECYYPTGNKEIYLPWEAFNGRINNAIILDNTARKLEAMKIASKVHPVWERCNDAVRRFHARNVYQVFGEDLKTPSDFVICWTEGGATKGGTATAINLAKEADIPVLNLGEPGWEHAKVRDVFDYLKENVSGVEKGYLDA